jgi:hypothetical protein
MKLVKIALLVALFMLPASSILIHGHVHPGIDWIIYLAAFDAVVITALFYVDKTKTYAFWLNTVIALGGVIYHAMFSPMGTLSDSMILVADIAVGYALYALAPAVVRKGKK